MSTSPISSGKFIVITTVFSPTSDHRSLYKWDKQIGEGAFGRVYGAVRKSDGLKVAIKEVEKSKMNVSCDDVPLEVRLNTEQSAGSEPTSIVDHHPAAGEGHPWSGHHH